MTKRNAKRIHRSISDKRKRKQKVAFLQDYLIETLKKIDNADTGFCGTVSSKPGNQMAGSVRLAAEKFEQKRDDGLAWL